MLLFFFHSAHCHSCKVAMPELNALRAKRYDFTVIFREVDGLHSTPGQDTIEGWRPRSTPGYAVVEGGQLIDTHQGAMKTNVLSKWLDACKAKSTLGHENSLAGRAKPAPLLKAAPTPRRR